MYFTPKAVIGQLVNQEGGQVAIINVPYHTKKIIQTGSRP